MIQRVEFLDSWQNVYSSQYFLIVKFEDSVYKVDTSVEVLRDMSTEELVGYVNNFFPDLGGDFKITRLS